MDSKYTHSAPFTKIDNTKIDVATMYDKNNFGYLENANARGIVKHFAVYDTDTGTYATADTKNKVDKLKNVNNQKLSLVKCKLETGRTHQIRIHLASIGHPLLGDSLYGEESSLIDRQALHACKICFIHPVTKEKIEIVSEIPDDMKSILYL